MLRIEDTDVARSREEWVVGIQDTLRWLGIDWDEGPILPEHPLRRCTSPPSTGCSRQGDAYECYCTEDEVRERNDAAIAAGHAPGYDGHCRALTPDERVALAAEGRPRTIRFRTPDEGVSSFTDLIRGEVRVEWALIHDFVIVRSDGAPIFFLANAVDDIDMGITHVIRGEDLIDSTHRVLALRAALGGDRRPGVRAPPAHRRRRVAGEAVEAPRRGRARGLPSPTGYLPEALLNYLALLGWAPADDGDEVLGATSSSAQFDLDRVTHAAAGFDRAKLDWMNGEWIRRLDRDELDRAGASRSRRSGSAPRSTSRSPPQAVGIAQERAVTLVQIVDQMAFLFVDDADFRDRSPSRGRSSRRPTASRRCSTR